jgi:hypothetical protein
LMMHLQGQQSWQQHCLLYLRGSFSSSLASCLDWRSVGSEIGNLCVDGHFLSKLVVEVGGWMRAYELMLVQYDFGWGVKGGEFGAIRSFV